MGNLQAGSWLQTSSGTWVQATAVRKYHRTGTVHDLTVDGAHNYHVLVGATPVLVHNCGSGGHDDPSGYAIVNMDRGAPDGFHASIEVHYDGKVQHTERVGMNPNERTIIRRFRGELSSINQQIKLALPNAREAMNQQNHMMGRSGNWNQDYQNCITHCADVLNAGGRDFPMKSAEAAHMILETLE